MTSYKCPECGGDCDAYRTCSWGGCPDGRDQPRLTPDRSGPEWQRGSGAGGLQFWEWVILLAIVLLFCIAS
jgi:hypothetical protein